MIISSRCISVAIPSEGEADHVLILTPLDVLVKVRFVTLFPTTGSSFEYLPRLPMLMPWPGPQVTLVMVLSLFPLPIETQSSPVPVCRDIDTLECDIVAPQNVDVEILDVEGSYVLNCGIGNEVEPHINGDRFAIFVFVAVIFLPSKCSLAVKSSTT
ncbi:hypothetical protein ACFX1T_012694 [Malus domestica]